MVACESRRSAHHVEEEGANEGVSRHPSKSNPTVYAGQVDVEKSTLVRFKSTEPSARTSSAMIFAESMGPRDVASMNLPYEQVEYRAT